MKDRNAMNISGSEHLAGEQFVQLLYEPGLNGAARKHLEQCQECNAELEIYRRALEHAAVWHTPERSADYGQKTWMRVAPLLPSPRRRSPCRQARLAWAPAFATVLVLALIYLTYRGKISSARVATTVASRPAETDEQNALFQLAFRDHAERASVLLSELANNHKPPVLGPAEWNETVDDLLAQNRLFRQTAEQQDNREAALVLGELETVLIDLEHRSSAFTSTEARGIQQRLEQTDLLFKLRAADRQPIFVR